MDPFAFPSVKFRLTVSVYRRLHYPSCSLECTFLKSHFWRNSIHSCTPPTKDGILSAEYRTRLQADGYTSLIYQNLPSPASHKLFCLIPSLLDYSLCYRSSRGFQLAHRSCSATTQWHRWLGGRKCPTYVPWKVLLMFPLTVRS